MASMSIEERPEALSEEEIDRLVEAQADDDSAWGKPIHVRRTQSASITLPADLAARAAFFARLHHAVNIEDWLHRVIQERLDMEEAAFAAVKRDLSTKSSG
jgi:hypothetical protein